jgi:beta-hydroxyacyl-ACP dehydratase FabZ
MQETIYDIRKIMTMLPHRFPFLLVDRIVESHDPGGSSRVGRKMVGIKNVTINEPYFNGHFPEMPIMPGVLQLEAMAQVAGISYYRKGDPPMDFMIASVQNARWRKPVVPGDVLRISIEITKDRGPMVQIDAKIHVDGEVVSEATILAFIQPKSNRSAP